jgi:hypothetical protein
MTLPFELVILLKIRSSILYIDMGSCGFVGCCNEFNPNLHVPYFNAKSFHRCMINNRQLIHLIWGNGKSDLGKW